MPQAARSRAACIPPIPPPTINAAPTFLTWVSWGDIAGDLLRGPFLLGLLFQCLEVKGQWAVDHMGPFAESHLDHKHRGRDHEMDGIGIMRGKLQSCIPENMDEDSTEGS